MTRGWWAQTTRLLHKDLLTERRTRATVVPAAVFAFAALTVLGFALPDAGPVTAAVSLPVGTARLATVLAGFFWITTMFAGVVGMAAAHEEDRREGALEALVASAADPASVFAARAAANWLLLAAVGAVLAPAVAVFFGIAGTNWIAFALVVALVDIGFAATGTLFAALAAGTRSRELLLPLLALPAVSTPFLAGVELTAGAWVGEPITAVAARGWFVLVVAYDVIFGIVGALTYEFALDR